VYGPHVNAASILLAREGNVPIERPAALLAMMLGAPVSTGFVARALERFAQRLAAAGFDDAMKTALRAEDVLGADETPTNVISKNTDEHGEPVHGCRHAVTVRTPDARLVWYAAMGSRSKTDIAGLGVLDGYAGYLRMATEASLGRVGIGAFDLLLLHNPNRTGYGSPAVWEGMAALREAGLTRRIGVAPGRMATTTTGP